MVYEFRINNNPNVNKSLILPIGKGYSNDRRAYDSIIVHTTNGNKGSTSYAEARFLATSPKVSAHYLIGKDGTIYNTLPLKFTAWHAGSVSKPIYSNARSIGIEVHFTPLERLWTPVQTIALTNLTEYLIDLLKINEIQTHRHIAVPKGRKIDPSGFEDSDFNFWVKNLFKPNLFREYMVKYDYVNIRSRPSINSARVDQVNSGTTFYGYTEQFKDLDGNKVNGSNLWVKIANNSYVHSTLV